MLEPFGDLPQDLDESFRLGAAEQGDGLEAGGHSADYTIIEFAGIIISRLW